MRVVVLGAGAVGFNLASSLSSEGHDVSVVERRAEQLQRLRDRLDVQVVEGSGTSAGVLREAGVEHADLFVAVTDSDEVNMVACALSHELGAARRIARVRNPDFSGRDPVVPKRTFGISRIINPEDVVVSTLVQSILEPGVTDAAEFGDGEVLLRGIVLGEGSPFLGETLSQLRTKLPELPFLIAAIMRDDEVLIPTGNTVLQARDHVFLILSREGVSDLRQITAVRGTRVNRLVIYGATRIGRRLAAALEGRVEHVVVIDEDENAAQTAAEELSRTLVLRGAITDAALLDEAHIARADYFVAASGRDEMNLVAATLIGKRGDPAPRVGVITSDPDFVPALTGLDLDHVINERLITVEALLRFVRPGRYLSVKRLNEQGAEIMELSVQKGAKADGKPLYQLGLPRGALVVAVIHEGTAVLPQGGTEVHSGDKVVLVALPGVREKAARTFFNKRWVKLQELR